jgi:hypothetical protein
MSNRMLALGFLVPLVVGCTTIPVPSQAAVPSTTATVGLAAASPRPSPTAVLSPCSVDQLNLTAGHAGSAGGTNYLTVFVELA